MPGGTIARLPHAEQSRGLAGGGSWNYIPHVGKSPSYGFAACRLMC